MKEYKLCINCKWFSAAHIADCLHPENLKTDFVNGGFKATYTPQYLRETDHWCSVDGYWFEAKKGGL